MAKTKYIVLLCDGMADEPLAELGGKTPLEVAHKPNMDNLACKSVLGTVKTVSENLQPGSDVANLSVLGYAPEKYYSGRAPIEAVSMGVYLDACDVAVRCNLVTLSDESAFEQKQMIDHTAGEISTEEALELMEAMQANFGDEVFSFFAGLSYRHCMRWKNGETLQNIAPPHDILGQKISGHLPENRDLKNLVMQSFEVLKNHPVNINRVQKGLLPANAIWLWGEGKKLNLPSFKARTGLVGAMISAVDLLKGIAMCADMQVFEVEGATGTLNTNYEAKAKTALKALEQGADFVYIHVEAPDECAHQGDVKGKIKAIENIDARLLSPLLNRLCKISDDYRILIMPDHATPCNLRTHTKTAVPFMLYKSRQVCENAKIKFTEITAKNTKLALKNGAELSGIFLEK